MGEDVGCELFQQTLEHQFLPQFELSSNNFTNEYNRNADVLERNLRSALQIDYIQSPKNSLKINEETD